MSNEEYKEFEKLNELFQKVWRTLYPWVQPKVHLWEHLVKNMWTFRGLRHHNEGQVELEHQIGTRAHAPLLWHQRPRAEGSVYPASQSQYLGCRGTREDC